MATLFDLAQAYLNRALPETFKYDRTNPPTIGPVIPVQPEPIKKILPVQSGSDNFSVYNPDPTRTRTKDDYSPYAARQFGETSLIGSGDSQFDINKYGTGFRTQTEANKFMDMYPDYYNVGPKTGIEKLAGMMPGQAVIKGIASLLPTSDRGILENELTGQGFAIDDVGRFVAATPGTINTAENIMAGYSAYRTDASTFQKRRDMINAKMSDTNINPKTGKTYKQEKLDALDEAEKRFFEAKGITTGISNQRKKAKDIDDGFINDQGSTYDEAGIKSILDTKPKTITDRGRGQSNVGTKSKGSVSTKGQAGPPSQRGRQQNKTTPGPKPGSSNPRRSGGPGDRGRGQSNVGTKSKGSVSTKGQAGPPSQRGGGGGGGGGGGCFLKGTLITMLDGTRKPVEQVDLGNEVAIGGKVFATGKFLVKNLHDYKGIKVSGSHMVSENNKWVRVEDSEHGKLLGNEEHTVYVFGSENRRILINDILFTDYFEVNEQDKLINNEEDFFDNWKLYAKQDSGNNVDIINAS